MFCIVFLNKITKAKFHRFFLSSIRNCCHQHVGKFPLYLPHKSSNLFSTKISKQHQKICFYFVIFRWTLQKKTAACCFSNSNWKHRIFLFANLLQKISIFSQDIAVVRQVIVTAAIVIVIVIVIVVVVVVMVTCQL